MITQLRHGKKLTALLAGAALIGLAIGAERAVAFRGGFGGFHGGFGGFHGGFGGGFGGFRGGGFGGFRGGGFGGFHDGSFAGGARFGDGGFADRSTDAGFGRGGWGSIHNAGTFSDRADTFNENHPDWRQNTAQFQQNRFNEANQLQSNRYNETNYLQGHVRPPGTTTMAPGAELWGPRSRRRLCDRGDRRRPARRCRCDLRRRQPVLVRKRSLLHTARRTIRGGAPPEGGGRRHPVALCSASIWWRRDRFRLRRRVLHPSRGRLTR